MSLNIELARHNMIEQQVRPWDVLDSRVLEALTAVRREDFVPPACRNLAFADLCLPLGHDETMMKPVVEGRILQAASPTRAESVLEIGTGSGFLTACLARLSSEVLSVDVHADFARGFLLGQTDGFDDFGFFGRRQEVFYFAHQNLTSTGFSAPATDLKYGFSG